MNVSLDSSCKKLHSNPLCVMAEKLHLNSVTSLLLDVIPINT